MNKVSSASSHFCTEKNVVHTKQGKLETKELHHKEYKFVKVLYI